MTTFEVALFTATIYRIVTMLVGCYLISIGYRLFLEGFVDKAGNLKLEGKGITMSLVNTSPGIFFATFGTIVICFSIWRGIEIEIPETHVSTPPTPSVPVASKPTPPAGPATNTPEPPKVVSPEKPSRGGGGGKIRFIINPD